MKKISNENSVWNICHEMLTMNERKIYYLLFYEVNKSELKFNYNFIINSLSAVMYQ